MGRVDELGDPWRSSRYYALQKCNVTKTIQMVQAAQYEEPTPGTFSDLIRLFGVAGRLADSG